MDLGNMTKQEAIECLDALKERVGKLGPKDHIQVQFMQGIQEVVGENPSFAEYRHSGGVTVILKINGGASRIDLSNGDRNAELFRRMNNG